MNMTPSQDQVMGQLRMLLPSIGMLLAALGFGTTTENATVVTLILQIAGPAMILGGMVWSLIANSRKSIMQSATQNLNEAAPVEKAAMVAAVAALPEVKAIDLDKTQPATPEINAATPPNVKPA